MSPAHLPLHASKLRWPRLFPELLSMQILATHMAERKKKEQQQQQHCISRHLKRNNST